MIFLTPFKNLQEYPLIMKTTGSGSVGVSIAICNEWRATNKWAASKGSGSAEQLVSRPLTTLALAIPLERRGIGVPSGGCGLKPLNNLLGRSWGLTVKGTTLEQPLNGLSHIEPTATE